MKKDSKTEIVVKKKKISEKSIADLPDAISGDSLDLAENSRLIIRISRSGKSILCECTVKKVEDNGIVHVWNETLEQWFAFEKKEAVSSKMFIKRLNAV